MKVDRSKFLFLAGALSAGTLTALVGVACTTSTTDVSPMDSGTSDVDNGGDGSVGSDDGGNEAGDAGDGGICLDDTVPSDGDAEAGAGDCLALVDNGCDFVCETVNSTFKQGIAADIHACLLGLPSCEGESGVKECVAASAVKACDDATAVTECAPLLALCNPDGGPDGTTDDAGAAVFNKTTCEAAMKTLSADGRASFINCVTEGIEDNCTSSPGFCVDQALMSF